MSEKTTEKKIRRNKNKKEIECPRCGGTGKISKFVPIDEMTNLQLAKKIHKRAIEKWRTDESANSIVALACELKSRLKIVKEQEERESLDQA